MARRRPGAAAWPEPLQAHVAAVLERRGLLGARLVLALSGGLDSMVLLHALHAIAARHPLQLSAVHVDHGISADAGRWSQFCAQQCAALGIELTTVAVEVARDSGSGLEAAARAARYAVLARQPADAVLLAHHLDDQAETLLLQLLRGAGPAGLAAMGELRALPESRALLLRPLLEIPRAELAGYAARQQLAWVEDDGNATLDFDRNYLRHEVLPRIATRFPGYRQTWLRASRNLADASELAGDLAQLDAVLACKGDVLRVSALRGLSQARRLNLLRWFLHEQRIPAPPRERLEEALDQLLDAALDRSPCVRLGQAALRRHRGAIHAVPADPPATGWRLPWSGEPELTLPAGFGAVRFARAAARGLDVERLRAGSVSVAPRCGGERLKLAPERPERSLKNLLREAGLAPWERERLPLLFCDDRLVWAAGIGWDCRYAVHGEGEGIVPQWLAEGRDRPHG
jgi:tRNA(Ile)-lysidine synthase